MRLQLSTLLLGLAIAGQGQPYHIEKLGNGINTVDYDEVAPVISSDGQTLFFTRVDHPDNSLDYYQNGSNRTANWPRQQVYAYLAKEYSRLTGSYVADARNSGINQDIWLARSSYAEAHDRIEHPGYPVNNALPNSVCSATPQPGEYVVVNQFKPDGSVFPGFSLIREQGDGSFSFPEALDIDQYKALGTDVNLNLSADGQHIVLSMRGRDSQGQHDLYVSHRQADGRWGAPRNLGPSINSSDRDITPFLSRDGKTLYFASNRNSYNEKTDIFRSTRLDESWQRWSRPERLPYPINDRSSESQPCFSYVTGYLYFTSTRDAQNDIFRVRVELPRTLLHGSIVRSDTRQALPADFLLIDHLSGDTLRRRSENGIFDLSVEPQRRYTIVPLLDGFIVQPRSVDVGAEGREYHISLTVDPKAANARISLPNIYFQQSLPDVQPGSMAALDQLYKVMSDYPGLHIRVEGHTDNRGKREDLVRLSYARANSIRDYLLGKGIAPDRVEAEGFGPDRPLTDNSTEALCEENRRVEVRIVRY